MAASISALMFSPALARFSKPIKLTTPSTMICTRFTSLLPMRSKLLMSTLPSAPAAVCSPPVPRQTEREVELSLLIPPAENSAPFVRAICERPGALRRVKEIVQIYKTLPREQHDDVVVNAAILAAKVANMADLKEEGMGVADARNLREGLLELGIRPRLEAMPLIMAALGAHSIGGSDTHLSADDLANFAAHQPDNEGVTPLYIACQQGHSEVATLLLGAGAAAAQRAGRRRRRRRGVAHDVL